MGSGIPTGLRRKYGARAYVIRHLKRDAVVPPEMLVRIYCSLIRPIFEYAAAAFHTLLTQEQSECLERMQRMTLKTIFGWNLSYEECLERSGLQTLKRRREDLFANFTRKAYKSGRFYGRWFQEHKASGYGLRRENEVVQKFALRDRLKNAPCYKMRELINCEARNRRGVTSDRNN